MPSRDVPCLVPRCREYAVPGRSYCAEHLGQRWALGMTGERRVGPSWARLRRIVFARQHGLCICGATATVVHHRRSAYDDSLDNLVALCDRCHRREHAAGQPRRL
jgi:5-methylcytosine-specific restriction endonuclease McrA